jgi:carbon-monoxide dehydrogenase large subunit
MEDEEIKKWRLKERDYKLITGHGIYVNDIKLPGMLYCNVVSSPYAHARINCFNLQNLQIKKCL